MGSQVLESSRPGFGPDPTYSVIPVLYGSSPVAAEALRAGAVLLQLLTGG